MLWYLCWNAGRAARPSQATHSDNSHQLGLKRRLQQTEAPSIRPWLARHMYILIYLYEVNVDTGGSLGKSIIYSNPQPCAVCDLP